MSDIEARLERLELADASRELSHRYARALDAKDLAALAALFTEDSVLEIPDHVFTGREAVIGFFREALGADPGTKRHFMMNHAVVATTATSATMRSYFLYTTAGPQLSVIGWGDYEDDVVLADDGARFRRKRIAVALESDVLEGWATE